MKINTRENAMNHTNTITLIKTLIDWPFLRSSSILLAVVLVCFGLLPRAQAVNPAPDGGYPGGNTAEGQNALLSLTTGTYNTAVGLYSLLSNTDGSFNTGVGAATLLLNVGNPTTGEGIENTATGAGVLLNNTTGTANTANGAFALFSNTTGGANTAIGDKALFSNTDGEKNTATGVAALSNNTIGNSNTATGYAALYLNVQGESNTAAGAFALFFGSTGSFNTANGFEALLNNSGNNNTATGFQALAANTSGSNNTASGLKALFSNSTGGSNAAVGDLALYNNTTGSANVALGNAAGFNATTGNGNVYIGVNVPGVADESNACYIASIFGQTSVNGVPVLINSDNKLGTTTSSKRFKEEIKPMDKASEAVLALKPVTFRYKKEIDPAGRSQFGLVAEEVEQVNPDLVVRDKEGRVYSVRYDAVNAMLLNEFLKEHKQVEELKNDFQSTVALQNKQIQALTAQLKQQAEQIQKVSAQLEIAKPATKLVRNNP